MSPPPHAARRRAARIESLRGSDVDASLYWLARMLEAGMAMVWHDSEWNQREGRDA